MILQGIAISLTGAATGQLVTGIRRDSRGWLLTGCCTYICALAVMGLWPLALVAAVLASATAWITTGRPRR